MRGRLAVAGLCLAVAPALACSLLNDTSYLTRDYGKASSSSGAGGGAPTPQIVLSAASAHTCALAKGALLCWGDNTGGQLALSPGTLAQSTRPIALEGGFGPITGVATGDATTCALGASGRVWCVGSNGFGVLGPAAPVSSDPVASFTPLLVATSGAPLANARSLSGRRNDVCAVLDDGVHCWGYDENGQTGDPSNALAAPTPVIVPNTGAASDVAVGSKHSCAILAGPPKRVACWGLNGNDALGAGTQDPSSNVAVPARLDLAGASAPVALAVGGDQSCALDDAGRVVCWGGDDYGQTGPESSGNGPHEVTALKGATAIAAGGNPFGTSFTCALSAGTVLCMGANDRGQLGRGTSDAGAKTPHEDPAAIQGLSGVTALALGDAHACAVVGDLAKDGKIVCWGANESGQLGDGTKTDRAAPVEVCATTGPCPLH